MKKGLVYLIFMLGLTYKFHAQENLVPNSSFEDTTQCPFNPAQIALAPPWVDPTNASPDLFNTCSDGGYVGVPNNICGFQLARTGSGYAGFATYYAGSSTREYIQVQLSNQLQIGKNYYCEFYVSLADVQSVAANNIGAYFSNIAITGSSGQVFNCIPQINNNPIVNPLIDKLGWTKISGNFIASGTENYVTIGNFLDDPNTDTTHVSGGSFPASYYYIDDVSVVCADCDTGIGINELNDPFRLTVYPNPAQNIVNIMYEISNNKDAILNIYDFTGKSITMQQLSAKENTFVLNTSNLSNGVYLCMLTLDNSVSSKRLIIAK